MSSLHTNRRCNANIYNKRSRCFSPIAGLSALRALLGPLLALNGRVLWSLGAASRDPFRAEA